MWNASELLGVEVDRRKGEKIICCMMTKKIEEIAAKCGINNDADGIMNRSHRAVGI
jgi:hypothetical protein